MTPTEASELFTRVRAAAEGTPYVVTETDQGFDVTLDIVDAQWFGLYHQAGLTKVFIHHVAVPKPGAYTVTDESREVTWRAGVPSAQASATRELGRVKEFGAQKVWAFGADGTFGVQADYRFNSEEGRDLIAGVADQLGLTSQRGAAEKIGLYVGLFAAAGAVVVVIALVVVALAGGFS